MAWASRLHGFNSLVIGVRVSEMLGLPRPRPSAGRLTGTSRTRDRDSRKWVVASHACLPGKQGRATRPQAPHVSQADPANAAKSLVDRSTRHFDYVDTFIIIGKCCVPQRGLVPSVESSRTVGVRLEAHRLWVDVVLEPFPNPDEFRRAGHRGIGMHLEMHELHP